MHPKFGKNQILSFDTLNRITCEHTVIISYSVQTHPYATIATSSSLCRFAIYIIIIVFYFLKFKIVPWIFLIVRRVVFTWF